MTSVSPSDRLYAKIELLLPALRRSGERAWNGPSPAARYRRYLVVMHSISRSAVPLMEVARDTALALAPDDPVAAQLLPFLEHHIPEETGHDVWILEDLAAADADPRDALDALPTPAVAAVVGAQYYWVRHYHPVVTLGYLAAMEGYPPGQGFAGRMSALTGFDDNAFRSIIRHSRIDIRHRREICEAIDAIPLSPAQEHGVAVAALATIQGLITVFDELAAWSPPDEGTTGAYGPAAEGDDDLLASTAGLTGQR